MSLSPSRLLVLIGAVLLGFPALAGAAESQSPLHVVATGLANPRKLAVTSDGSVLVAEAGSGGRDLCYTSSGAKTCVGLSGAIVRVSASGKVTKVVTGLPSAASTDGSNAEGPAGVLVSGDRYLVLLGAGRINGSTRLGADGTLLGDLVSTGAGKVSATVLADLGAYETAHNPDKGAGPGAASGDPPLDSNPYAVTAYRGGYAIVDAAANDLLWLSPKGTLSVLAVFPTEIEHAAAGVVAKKATSVTVQSVPSSVAVGSDGALYVGELTGYPFGVGKARIWRVVPGHKATVFASGFTNISDVAFDGKALLVLEIAANGLRDASSPGELIRLSPDGTRTVLARAGLIQPTGLAVTHGWIYVSNEGTSARSGALVRLAA